MAGEQRDEVDRLASAAGGSVADHVRALLAEAERKAADMAAEASADAERLSRERIEEAELLHAQALEAALAVLQRVTAIEERLGVVVAELREDALALPGGREGVAGLVPDEAPPPSAIPGMEFDAASLAANLRSILDASPSTRRPGSEELPSGEDDSPEPPAT